MSWSSSNLSGEGKIGSEAFLEFFIFFRKLTVSFWGLIGPITGQSVLLLKALMLMLGNNILAWSRPFLSQSKINACSIEIFLSGQ